MRVMPPQILIWCCCLLLVQLATALTGDNVCNRTELESETIEYVVTEPVTFRLYTWCLKMPPRCSKYTTIMKERIKTKLQINNQTIDFCCDGYVQLETYCVPQCNKTECPHMKCDSEKKCVCEAGYYGQRCHRTCRAGFWGENCNNKCVCNGEPCNLINGDCLPMATTKPLITILPNNTATQQSAINETKEVMKTSVKTSLNNNQPSMQLTTTKMISTQHQTKFEKTELSQEIDESDLDPTMIPMGISLEDMDTTLLPEDEVIIVYPSTQIKSYTPISQPQLITKVGSEATITSKMTTQKFTQVGITKPPSVLEKTKKSSTTDYYSKIHELKLNKKFIDFHVISTTEPTRIIVDSQNKNNNKHTSKSSLSNNKKYYGSTALPSTSNIKYSAENTIPKKSNGLPPPVPDGSDNSIQIKSNGFRNVTVVEENEDDNNNLIKSNDIQRDMGELNTSNNFSRPNTDRTVNSSLVKAKWNSALGIFDFSAPSTIISIIVTVILFMAVIVIIITHCKKNKTDQSSSPFYNNVKTCHDNAVYAGQYLPTPGGQPIFFCPAFTNTYAFELAQELREAHYDHPRSARCLINEPVYAELQY